MGHDAPARSTEGVDCRGVGRQRRAFQRIKVVPGAVASEPEHASVHVAESQVREESIDGRRAVQVQDRFAEFQRRKVDGRAGVPARGCCAVSRTQRDDVVRQGAGARLAAEHVVHCLLDVKPAQVVLTGDGDAAGAVSVIGQVVPAEDYWPGQGHACGADERGCRGDAAN